MRRTLIPSLALLALCLAGCQFLPQGWNRGAESQKPAPVATESVLYARDGTIVTPSRSQTGSNMPRRDVQNAEGTRTKILELYERVIEERDQLRLTLAAQTSEMAQLRLQLDEQRARANDFETRTHAAEQARADLTTQNLDLAGRLTTAQIKRLEAEKKWLELSISLPSKVVASSDNPPASPGPKPAVRSNAESSEHH